MADITINPVTLVTNGGIVTATNPLPTSGGGTPGTPSTGVTSVQGVAGMTPIEVRAGTEYETVAASQTGQVLGGTGAIGDYLSGLLVIPATVNPGNVLLLDNAISITVFAGGTASVSSLVPFFIPIGAKSVSGAWKVTTGANVSVLAIGDWT